MIFLDLEQYKINYLEYMKDLYIKDVDYCIVLSDDEQQLFNDEYEQQDQIIEYRVVNSNKYIEKQKELDEVSKIIDDTHIFMDYYESIIVIRKPNKVIFEKHISSIKDLKERNKVKDIQKAKESFINEHIVYKSNNKSKLNLKEHIYSFIIKVVYENIKIENKKYRKMFDDVRRYPDDAAKAILALLNIKEPSAEQFAGAALVGTYLLGQVQQMFGLPDDFKG